MHKYYLRLLVDEERKTPPGEEKQPARNVLSLDFHETTFIAVTAYQNEEVGKQPDDRHAKCCHGRDKAERYNELILTLGDSTENHQQSFCKGLSRKCC